MVHCEISGAGPGGAGGSQSGGRHDDEGSGIAGDPDAALKRAIERAERILAYANDESQRIE
jgi:hypothetical protein